MASSADMDAAQAREAALELIKSKDAKELELGQLHEALQSQNAELGQSLIDPEGFPRGDIDVHNVRLTRVRVIELRNDIKAISEKIKELLEVALARPPPSESKASTSSAREEAAPLPFALCNGVAPGSPAATAGLRRGDKFVRFGSIKFDNHDTLRAVAAEVQQNENRSMTIDVMRKHDTTEVENLVSLVLMPKVWSGRGLLGCHIVPV